MPARWMPIWKKLARHEPLFAQAAQQRHVPCLQRQLGVVGQGGDLAGEVDQRAAVVVGAGSDDDVPAGREHPPGAVQDVRERVHEPHVPAAARGAGEVREVLPAHRVAPVALLDLTGK